MKTQTNDSELLGFALLVLVLYVVLFVCTLLPFCNVPFLLAVFGLFPTSVVFWLDHARRSVGNPFYRQRKGAAKNEANLPPQAPHGSPPDADSVWLHRLVNWAAVLCAVGVVCSAYGLRSGSAEMREGQYVSGNYKLGIPYRSITREEYWRLNRHEARIVTCLCILACTLPVASGIWERRNRKTNERGGPT